MNRIKYKMVVKKKKLLGKNRKQQTQIIIQEIK